MTVRPSSKNVEPDTPENRSLLRAIQCKNLEKMELALSRGAFPDGHACRDGQGELTFLSIALKKGFDAGVDCLLKWGANPGHSAVPFETKESSGLASLSPFLLFINENPISRTLGWLKYYPSVRTPAHLLEGMRTTSDEAVFNALFSYARQIPADQWYGSPVLKNALLKWSTSKQVSLHRIQALYSLCSARFSEQEKTFSLFRAISRNDEEMLDWLLSIGASRNLILPDPKTSQHMNAYHQAIVWNRVGMLSKLEVRPLASRPANQAEMEWVENIKLSIRYQAHEVFCHLWKSSPLSNEKKKSILLSLHFPTRLRDNGFNAVEVPLLDAVLLGKNVKRFPKWVNTLIKLGLTSPKACGQAVHALLCNQIYGPSMRSAAKRVLVLMEEAGIDWSVKDAFFPLHKKQNPFIKEGSALEACLSDKVLSHTVNALRAAREKESLLASVPAAPESAPSFRRPNRI